MANAVITSSTNCIKVVFNDLAEFAKREKGIWRKENIRFDLNENDAGVTVTVEHEPQWVVSYNGTYGMTIDTVDGATPSSDSDLYDKLMALLG